MANNRLYIVNTDTNEYICIAKCNDLFWNLGNENLLNKFLEASTGIDGKKNLKIGSELDLDFYEKYIKNGTNFNLENIWKYFNENTDD